MSKPKTPKGLAAKFEALQKYGELLKALDKDLVEAFRSGDLPISKREIRFMVDLYYEIQEFRKAVGNQVLSSGSEPTLFLDYMLEALNHMEKACKAAFDAWSREDPFSAFPLQVVGIGPVICAGLSATIDMDVATNPSKIWALAGYDPNRKWLGAKEGAALAKEILGTAKTATASHVAEAARRTSLKPESIQRQLDKLGKPTLSNFSKVLSRRPWNARFHSLCWKIGDLFKKQSGKEGSFYGHLYQKFKLEEVGKNDRGDHASTASEFLTRKTRWTANQKTAYRKGRFTDGHVDLRAMRRVVKIFLVNWWQAAYEAHYHKDPPRPYVESTLKHSTIWDWRQVLEYERKAREKSASKSSNPRPGLRFVS